MCYAMELPAQACVLTNYVFDHALVVKRPSVEDEMEFTFSPHTSDRASVAAGDPQEIQKSFWFLLRVLECYTLEPKDQLLTVPMQGRPLPITVPLHPLKSWLHSLRPGRPEGMGLYLFFSLVFWVSFFLNSILDFKLNNSRLALACFP